MRKIIFVNFKIDSKSGNKYAYEVVSCMNENEIYNIILTFYKIMCMLLSIPAASCSSERYFSSLRKIKT